MSCARCRSAICDGRVATCLGCGTAQCFRNGIGNGCCKVCHYGILPGWSGSSGVCSYRGCTIAGAFRYVRGKAYVCLLHAQQAQVRTTTGDGYSKPVPRVEKLAVYATRCAAEVLSRRVAAWRLTGVVLP